MSPTSAGAFRQDLDDKAVLMGLLQYCRVFVFPSTVEAMSMMMLEALAVGAAGIASDSPENTSSLPPGYPTFAAGDAAALARRLAVVIEWDEAAREALKQQGREWVRGRYEELYRRAAAGFSALLWSGEALDDEGAPAAASAAG